MKFRNIKRTIQLVAFLLSIVIFFSSASPVYATGKVEELEGAASELQSQISDLEKDLKTLNSEVDMISKKIKSINEELETTREELAIAKGQQEVQYESMVARIKYMYENGNHTILEMLLSSGCIAEFINRVEFFSAINDYDRKMLQEYVDNCEAIEKKEQELLDTASSLAAMQAELDSKETAIRKKISSSSEELSSYTAKIEKAKEEAKKAEEIAKEEIKPIIPETNSGSSNNNSTGSTATSTPGVSYTEEDVILLAALIECEAGSTHYEGMLAVGSVVVNRMKSRYYPNTLYGVVYQPNQFPPAHDGKVDRILARGIKSSCEKAARDALNGKNNVGKCVSFRAASSGRPGTIIGDNVFF